MIDRSNSLSEPRQDNTDGNQRRNPLSEKSAEYSALQLSNCKMKARRTREKEVELLVLSSQILQNLVLSSSSKYATVRTCSNFLFSRALSCSCLLLMIYQIIVILKNAMMLDILQQWYSRWARHKSNDAWLEALLRRWEIRNILSRFSQRVS